MGFASLPGILLVRIDHLRAIQSASYRGNVRATVAEHVEPGGCLLSEWLHEHDYSCCKKQSWQATLERIFGLDAEGAA